MNDTDSPPFFVADLSAFTMGSDTVSILIFEFLGHVMAQNSAIYKVELSVSDMDRHYYETHKLTVAKHPSETDERLMVRIVAFALNAHEYLEMTKGLSTDDEPDIWQKSLSGEIDVWVALGLPSEKVVRQSCGKADKVVVYPYGGRTAEMWWDKIKNSTSRFENLQVINFSEKDTGELAKLASRAMKLQINIQDGDVMVSVDDSIVYVTPLKWKSAA
ncbi:YaeQ family protein [Roseibium polysiphoniae]|uniref:YaeQ family protein n=1 Tax=Roseibium polysiphoniae TaxID=2571221 RepID=UPI00329A0E4D